MSATRLLIALALPLAGCFSPSEPDPDPPPDSGVDTTIVVPPVGDDSGAVEGPADIAVAPLELDLGVVPVGQSVSSVLVVTNVGEGELAILEVGLEEAGGGFSVTQPDVSVLAGGDSVSLSVAFHAQAPGGAGDVVRILSDDPDESIVEVPLRAVAGGGALALQPAQYDFGRVYVGCDATQMLTVENEGNAALVVSAVEGAAGSDAIQLDVEAAGALPWTLDPGASADVAIAFAPLEELDAELVVTVTSDAPVDGVATARFQGAGELAGSNVDSFEVSSLDEVDVLFAVDRSCSMTDHLPDLMANLGSLRTELDAVGVDYQIAALVDDDGCVNGSDLFIDGSFSATDAQSTFRSMINLGGSYGSNTERAFTLLEAGVSESVSSSGCNSGLVRQDAALALVGVSDEAEQSIGSYSYYVSLFQSIKADPSDVVVFGIGGDYPAGCSVADAYTGIYEASVATGGSLHSICTTDWAATMGALGADIAGIGGAQVDGTFALSDWPVVATLAVSVDGADVSTGWAYDATGNVVEFDASTAPGEGALVDISYALYGDCDE